MMSGDMIMATLQVLPKIHRGIGAVTRSYAVTEAQVSHDATRVIIQDLTGKIVNALIQKL
jgi:hypothetical protein